MERSIQYHLTVLSYFSDDFRGTQKKNRSGEEHHELKLDLKFSVDAFQVYILIGLRKFYPLVFTSNLLVFIFCSAIFLLLLCVFQQTIYCSPFSPSFFTTQWPIYLVLEIIIYGTDILKVKELDSEKDAIMASATMLQLDFVLYWSHSVLERDF